MCYAHLKALIAHISINIINENLLKNSVIISHYIIYMNMLEALNRKIYMIEGEGEGERERGGGARDFLLYDHKFTFVLIYRYLQHVVIMELIAIIFKKQHKKR